MSIEDLKFTKEDFLKIYGPGQGGPLEDLYLDFSGRLDIVYAAILANHVNRLLEKKLKSMENA